MRFLYSIKVTPSRVHHASLYHDQATASFRDTCWAPLPPPQQRSRTEARVRSTSVFQPPESSHPSFPTSGEDGGKGEPSNTGDGTSQKLSLDPTSIPAHVQAGPSFATAAAAADPSGAPASSFNPRIEAMASGGAPGLYQPISVTSLIGDTLHPEAAADIPPPGRVKERSVLKYFTRKHPKLLACLSAVLIAVGRIASHPAVAACVRGPILVALQAGGAIAVATGEWLRDELGAAGAAAPV